MENTPAWQLIKNVVEGGTTKKTEIIKAILLVNPEMNKNTIRAQITVCTVNNPSRINFGQNKKPRAEHNQYDFLYQEDKSTVVLYDSNKHGNWVLEDDGGKTKVAKSDSNDVGNLDITCPECGSPIVYYWGDIDSDTYRAYNIDENADMIEEEEVDISPRMDRVDEVKDEFFYMCSNHDCGWDWKTKEEFLNGDDDDEENDEENVGEDKLSEFKEQEKVAVGFWEFKSLADSVANEYYLGDKDWARILYKKAENIAEGRSDYSDLANSVADEDYLGDKDWARILYKKAEDLAEGYLDYKNLANSVADEDYLGDKDWAQILYKKAEDIAEDYSDYSDLADYVARELYLGDKDWARILYKKAEDLAEGFSDYRGIAYSVADEDYLGDKDWARILYKKALESGDSFNDFNELCNDYLDDKSRFDEESFEKSFEKALGLKSNADEYDINSFADALEKAGETDKMEKLRS
jgi:hypothetical protein